MILVTLNFTEKEQLFLFSDGSPQVVLKNIWQTAGGDTKSRAIPMREDELRKLAAWVIEQPKGTIGGAL